MSSLIELLVEFLWREGQFPSGGARTSKDRCRMIVNSALSRLAYAEGDLLIISSPEQLRDYVATLFGRDPDDLTTITLSIGDLRRLTEAVSPTYTTVDVVQETAK